MNFLQHMNKQLNLHLQVLHHIFQMDNIPHNDNYY